MIRPSLTDPAEQADIPTPSEINAQAGALAGESTEPNEHPSVLLETLAAPFRGAEDAVRNAYNGLDFLTGDALPDYHGDKTTNYLGTSQTMPGKVVENVAEFLTGFIPVVGVAGKAAKAAGLVGKAAKFAAAASAGAFADFVAFSGHEDRLSNLIQEYPALRNPVTAYLAADPNDSEATGRFKNALEGLALGALTEPLHAALNGMARVRGAKAGTVSAEAAKKAVAEAEGTVAKGVKSFRLSEAEKSAAASISAKPELKAISEQLSKLSDEEIGGGGLFQSPDKDIGRFIDSPQEMQAVLLDMSQRQQADELARGVRPTESIEVRHQKEAGLVAELTGADSETIAAVAEKNTADLQGATYLMGATRKMMMVQAQRVAYYAKLAAEGAVAPGLQTVDQTALASLRAQQLLSTLVLSSRNDATNVARALNSIKYTRYAEVESKELARTALEQLGGSKYVSAELQKIAAAGASENAMDAAKGVSELVRAQTSMGSRLLRAHNEYWINAILSGTKTSFVNTLGNTTTTLYQPLEQAIGGIFQKDRKAVAASLKNYYYLAQSFSDSWAMFTKALKENENVLLPTSKVNDLARGNAIDASQLVRGGTASQGLKAEASGLVSGDGNLMSHFVNFMGEATRLPSRFLTATDEFFKQLNYRAAAKTELHYRGLSQGLDGAALHGFVADNFENLITQGGAKLTEGAVIREGIRQAEAKGLSGKSYTDFMRDYVAKNFDAKKSALAENFDVTTLAQGVAEEATFTRPLGELGKGIQTFADSHPVTQLLIPFVRTPTNIVKYFGQRGLGAMTFMPGIGKLQARNVAELASADALVRSRAAGRIAAGQMLVSAAGMAALSGKITGSGPKDEQEKKTLMATGWQPYSIVIETAEGPHYVSYQRLDPFATFLGLIADWSEQVKRQDPMHADTLSTTLTAAATAVSNNITNKTYLASLSQAIDAINQPERRFATWSRARVGSYVPSLLAQWNSSLDDGQTMKEVRGFFDGAVNRIPGAQNMLEPKRNVLGEPVDSALAQTPMSWVNPFTLSKAKNDPVLTELAKLNHGLQPPSPVTNGNVNLLDHHTKDGRTAFDRYQELIGEVSVGGNSLRASLGKLVKLSEYQKLPLTNPSDGLDSPRLAEVKKVINAYRQAALYKLQQEVPSVRQAIRSSMEAQINLRRGDRAAALASVQAVIQAAQ